MSTTATVTKTAAAQTTSPKSQKSRRMGKRWQRVPAYKSRGSGSNLDANGEEKKKRHFKRSTMARKSAAYYSKGKGSVGMIIRRSRVFNWTRKCVANRISSMSNILLQSKRSRWNVAKSFVDPVAAALDSTAAQVMKLAYDFARPKDADPNDKRGVKLCAHHMHKAIKWHRMLSRK